ncbi:uncharacterized protein N0V96_011536 [Colletotrichum fioriniae]|uniref:uncharacterized protein n=1 Tax=Colletotrichum fioriniae TaxID=710243 RepID=UPI0032DA1EAB|nr:hypothetical protein N0V96_011536 [Colletotrichum fioriniae]
MAGASNAQDGITISFQNMKSITLSADKKIASIQPGNIWGDVYRELTKSDLNVIGGRIYDIGVGGLTTGGGISYFSNLHGWACDNVESYDVVTATGAIIRASVTQFADLYWALRGGGNNFGLVVSFNLRTISLPGGKMWGGSRTYLEDSFPALSGAYANFIANAERDPKAGLWHVYAYFNGTKLSLPTLYYAEPDGGDADIFSEWNAIPAISDTTQNRIIADWAAEGAQGSPPGPREIYSVISSKADKGLVDAAQEIYFEEVLAVTDLPGVLPTLVFQGITIPMLKHMQQNGGNALGLNVEDGPFYIILLSIMWSNEEDDDKIYSFASTVMERTNDEAKARGLENDYIYMNYAAQFQDVVSGYGAENKAKLKSIAKKYDPKGGLPEASARVLQAGSCSGPKILSIHGGALSLRLPPRTLRSRSHCTVIVAIAQFHTNETIMPREKRSEEESVFVPQIVMMPKSSMPSGRAKPEMSRMA